MLFRHDKLLSNGVVSVSSSSKGKAMVTMSCIMRMDNVFAATIFHLHRDSFYREQNPKWRTLTNDKMTPYLGI